MSPTWTTARYERPHWRAGKTLIAGVDEVGRGALAGPIVAAAVILPSDSYVRAADSKILSPQQREQCFVAIVKQAHAIAVAIIEADQIDRDGIDYANEVVMKQAVARLHLAPDHVFADAVRLREMPTLWETVVDGDSKIMVIAAASIIAKVTRDTIMRSHHRTLPLWGFDRHKGYGTDAHFASIRRHGLSKIHRRTFLSPG